MRSSRLIDEAVLLMQLARDKLEQDASLRDPNDIDRPYLLDVAADMGTLLFTLETIERET